MHTVDNNTKKLNLVLRNLGYSKKDIQLYNDVPEAFLSFYEDRQVYLKTSKRKINISTDIRLISVEYSIFRSLFSMMCNYYRTTQTLLENLMGDDFIDKIEKEDNFAYRYYANNGYLLEQLKPEMRDCCFSKLNKLFWCTLKK